MLLVTKADRQNIYTGFETLHCNSCADAADCLQNHSIDIAVVDMQTEHSISLCRHLHSNTNINIIALCSSAEEMQHAIYAGADDIATAPLFKNELAVRIMLLNQNHRPVVYRAAGITLDASSGTVTQNGKTVYLSILEYRILLLLIKNAGTLVSRQTILQTLSYDNVNYLNENTLTVYIKRLREKLGDTLASPGIIRTVRGKGYVLGR